MISLLFTIFLFCAALQGAALATKAPSCASNAFILPSSDNLCSSATESDGSLGATELHMHVQELTARRDSVPSFRARVRKRAAPARPSAQPATAPHMFERRTESPVRRARDPNQKLGTFVRQWGRSDTFFLLSSASFAVDSSGEQLFVADGKRLQVFRTADGSLVREFSGEALVDFRPLAIASDTMRDLLVVEDLGHPFVRVFRTDGSLAYEWNHHQFMYAMGFAVHPRQDIVFVVEQGNHRIEVVDLDGSLINSIGMEGTGNGQFKLPVAVAVHPTKEWLFVTDCENSRVQIFDVGAGGGQFIGNFGSPGSGPGQFRCPEGIALHPVDDLVYVADPENHRIQVFRHNGTFVQSWGVEGSNLGEFRYPTSLALHPFEDILFVGDQSNRRVQVYRA